MTPFPPVLQTLRPTPADVLPERPWWKKCPTYDPKGQARMDARYPGSRLCYTSSPYLRSDGKCADMVEDMAAIDASEPLPHPGFRASQTWGRVEGGRVSVQVIVEQSDKYLVVAAGLWLTIEKLEEDEGGYPWVGKWFHGCFLLADPQCPHLAPWAPVEIK